MRAWRKWSEIFECWDKKTTSLTFCTLQKWRRGFASGAEGAPLLHASWSSWIFFTTELSLTPCLTSTNLYCMLTMYLAQFSCFRYVHRLQAHNGSGRQGLNFLPYSCRSEGISQGSPSKFMEYNEGEVRVWTLVGSASIAQAFTHTGHWLLWSDGLRESIFKLPFKPLSFPVSQTFQAWNSSHEKVNYLLCGIQRS